MVACRLLWVNNVLVVYIYIYIGSRSVVVVVIKQKQKSKNILMISWSGTWEREKKANSFIPILVCQRGSYSNSSYLSPSFCVISVSFIGVIIIIKIYHR